MLKNDVRKITQMRGIKLPTIPLSDMTTSGTTIDSKIDDNSTRPDNLNDLFKKVKTHERNEEESQQKEPDISPASITSPIRDTLRHGEEYSREHDLNRTVMSQSFCLTDKQQEETLNNQETIDIRIFFPNGIAVQFGVQHGIDATAADLLHLMAEHMDIDDYSVVEEALAIWLVSPHLEIQLKLYHNPFEIYQKWPAFLRRFTNTEEDDIALDEPLLVLRRNVLLTLEREIQYEKLTEVLYLDARDEYLSGRYPVEIETALKLVGLQLAIEFGPYDESSSLEETLDLIYDNLPELATSHHIKAIRSFHLFGLRIMECRKGLEDRVIDEYKTASLHYKNDNERRKAFLSILRKAPFYGAAFYSGTMDKNKMEEKHNMADFGVDHDEYDATDGGHYHKQQDGSSRKTHMLPMNLLGRFRRLLHINRNGQYFNRTTTNRREIIIGINHCFITLIDPREQRLLEVLKDNSPEGNMSLNDKISLFCNN